MKREAKFFVFVFLILLGLNEKNYSYNFEVLLGNRAVFYQHSANANLLYKLRFNNVTQFENEYGSNRNNIYFIRNAVSYPILKRITLNAAFGIKNPGVFTSLFFNYSLLANNFRLNYSVGITLQEKYAYEQMFVIQKSFKINEKNAINTSFQALTNIAENQYIRGFQQIRVGISSHQYSYGIATNFDQFNNNHKTLSNYGIYFKKTL